MSYFFSSFSSFSLFSSPRAEKIPSHLRKKKKKKRKKKATHRRGQLLHQHVLEPRLGDATQLGDLLEKVLCPVRVADQHDARVDAAAAVAERQAGLVPPDDQVLALEALEGKQEGDVDDHGV